MPLLGQGSGPAYVGSIQRRRFHHSTYYKPAKGNETQVLFSDPHWFGLLRLPLTFKTVSFCWQRAVDVYLLYRRRCSLHQAWGV